MTSRTTRRTLIGALALTASLIGAATPAHAATKVTKTTLRSIFVTVTDCPKTGIGITCRAFDLVASYEKSKTGIETKSFEATGYSATTLAGGEISISTQAFGNTVTVGTFTMAPNGKSAMIKFTTTLGCLVPSCGFDGAHTFKLTIARDATKSAITGESNVQTFDVGQCQAVETLAELRHTGFKGTGKVTTGSTSKAIHVYQPNGKSNRLDSATATEKITSACDSI